MSSFRAKIMGRQESEPAMFQTTTSVNIRSGPGTEFPTIPGSPLPEGTTVVRLEASGLWVKVDVQATVNGVNDAVGWVHLRFLSLT